MTLSLFAVFGAGLLTFLSPCVLPLAPILIASLLTADADSRWARVRVTLWFALGFAAVFTLLGLGLPALVRLLGPARPLFFILAAAVMLLFGLRMLHFFDPRGRLAWMQRSLQLPRLHGRLPEGVQGLLFGALFGFSWTPCVGPILGGVLTYAAAHPQSPAHGAGLLLAYSAGVSLPLLLLAGAAESLAPRLRRLHAYLPLLEGAAGAALVVFAVVLLAQARRDAGALWRTRAGRAPVPVAAVTDAARRVELGAPGARARLVFFHSAHCPVCRAMEAFLPGLQQACGSGLALLQVDVDRPENATAAARFGVRAVPTTSILDAAGHEVLHLVGYQSPARLRAAAERVTPVQCARRDADVLPSPSAPPPDATCGLHTLC